ncbi:MAG: Gfo/Idh/MocA family oxidoreductase, partial [Planctomycetota bacterium]|nr:Gfo/Idh/MocA family oxidoreductase [Planctomycetota bacterium]
MATSSKSISRRGFLGTATAASAATALPAWFRESSESRLFAQETSPNERPRVALVGCGGMGTGDAKNAQRFGDVVAVCDVDAERLGKASETFKGAKGYDDYRQLCDDNGIDVVINGTPDHWHTLVNLRALRSGKDVYSEKPLTLTIDEGKHVVAAVKEHGRILQTGSQQRSDAKFRLACELVRNGRLGKIDRAKVWLPAGFNEGPFPPEPVPAGLDWDRWLGQAPKVEYTTKRCHLFFRYWWDYSGGTMTDWGAHHNDIVLWGLGKDRGGPTSVEGRPLV